MHGNQSACNLNVDDVILPLSVYVHSRDNVLGMFRDYLIVMTHTVISSMS